jgi:hypothetical protein
MLTSSCSKCSQGLCRSVGQISQGESASAGRVMLVSGSAGRVMLVSGSVRENQPVLAGLC